MTPTELRFQLLRAGYIPIPLFGKEPPIYGKNNKHRGFAGWQELTVVTPAQVEMWAKVWPDAINTGVLTTRTPAFDVDVMHAEAAEAVADLARERFEERGYILTRTGKAPKCAILFRTDAPFTKIFSNLTAPDGSPHKLEFLCAGQQIVVAGVHPETGRPYSWHGGMPGDVEHADLPFITGADAQQLVDEAIKLLIEQFRFQLAGSSSRGGNGVDPHAAGTDPQADPELIAAALSVIPNTVGWDEWNSVGMATWRATGGSGVGFAAFDAWSRKSPKYDPHITAKKWAAYFKSPPTSIGAGSIFYLAEQHSPGWRDRERRVPPNRECEPRPAAMEQEPPPDEPPSGPAHELPESVQLTDFVAYMPMHSYIYMRTGEMWPGASVNARIPPIPLIDAHGQPVLDDDGKPIKQRAGAWLDRHQPVEQMTWAPGLPMLIRHRLIVEGGWFNHPGATVFNQYKPPTLVPKRGDIQPWVDHVAKLYPDHADHIIKWLAHRVQFPQIKINHALVLGGAMRIGKDTLLHPVKHAVGPWNCSDITPKVFLERFNPFLKSVILFINEARDLGDFDRYAFYDHSKAIIASPPDTLLVDEKHTRAHRVPNLCGVIITTNHLTDGIYLPEDDGRHFVAWSELKKSDFDEDYWPRLYKYYENGGIAAVAHHLANLDLSGFNPKAPPPRTPAFWAIVDASHRPEDAELADVLDALGTPDATTLMKVRNQADLLGNESFRDWLKERKNSRAISHRFETCGYVPVRPDNPMGLWRIHGVRQTIYAKASLSVRDRHLAVRRFIRDSGDNEAITSLGNEP